MKVVFDSQIFDSQKIGGISRYFFELMSAYEKADGIDFELPVIYSDNEYLRHLPSVEGRLQPVPAKPNGFENFLGKKNFRGKHLLYRVKEKLIKQPPTVDAKTANREKTIALLKAGNFDIFHPTYYDSYFLDYIQDKPFIITVYDLIHQVFPEFGMYETRDKNKELLSKASRVIAISESTKSDLVNLFNIEAEKISVIYLANSLVENKSEVTADFKRKIPARYLLFVGWRGAYKNFLFFTQVVAALNDKDLFVVCTGAPFDRDEQYLFQKLGISDRFYHTFVNDSELIYLYQHAAAFIFPSQYEGFGLPLLEAMYWGCPVLASDNSSLREIGGDAVVYFDAKNASSMTRAIQTVLFDADLREKNIGLGYENVKQFSWEKTASETLAVYSAILQNSN